MPTNFELFKRSLDDAAAAIDASFEASKLGSMDLKALESIPDTESLLERCSAISETFNSGKPILRVIHHLACSGGTLVSKCISSLPNVYLLSEVHPYTELALGKAKPKFSPSDISSLARYGDFPDKNILSGVLFKDSVRSAYQHLNSRGCTLVLRDHTHSDFCVGERGNVGLSVIPLLADDFDIKSIVTLRNPIDSYLSLVNNNWVHHTPGTFEEYCIRILAMLDAYKDVPLVYYEDFVGNPKKSMKSICEFLDLPYSDYFEDVYTIFRVTGDSGRHSSQISNRTRRAMSEEFVQEVEASKAYSLISQKYNYTNEQRNSAP